MKTTVPSDVVIVGAGQAGATAAALLRQHGYMGRVTMLGQESWLPYHRPPLSKGRATDGVLPEPIHPEGFYEQFDIDVRTGTTVRALDLARKTVDTAAGAVPYGALILATGSSPRMLGTPGAGSSGVHTLRNYDDAAELGRRLQVGSRLVIIGGGYIGLEVAAAFAAHGVHVTVVERESRVLARVASEQLSQWVSRYHSDRGIEVLCDAEVVQFGEVSGSVASVLLSDGRDLACDTVLIGAGAIPNDSLARAAGIACDHGIVVDLQARTSTSDVYAIGDVARRPVGTDLPFRRLESIQNAVEQAKQAVFDLLGVGSAPAEVPRFWSDQFDLKIQTVGLFDHSRSVVERHKPDGTTLALFHLADSGRLVAVESVNDTPAVMAGRKWIAAGATPDPALLADFAVPLRSAVTNRTA